MKRPPSVWITQTLVLLFGLVVIVGQLANLVALLKQMTATPQTSELLGRLISFLPGLLILAVTIAAFWGLQTTMSRLCLPHNRMKSSNTNYIFAKGDLPGNNR
jgi:hypothetical protein